MALEARLSQRPEQRLALLPQMLQSIEVLQLATTELVQFLEQELQSNEALELQEQPEVVPEAPRQHTSEREDSGWDGEWRRGAPGDGDEDGKRAFLENLPAGGDTLADFVRLQLAWRELPPRLADAVLLLAQHLDERGLLPFTAAELAAEHAADEGLLAQALVVLQGLEPRGIGARTPVEAMLLQAVDDPDFDEIEQLLTRHLEALARNKLPEVAKELEVTLDELRELLERVRCLDPRPGAPYFARTAGSIRPDAFVWLRDGSVQVAIDDRALPELAVSGEYASLLADARTPRDVKDYLRKKVRSARELIDAVAHRQQTLLRVVAAVMHDQRAFLEHGRSSIKPLRMSDVAAGLGMHTSTVSRAIAGKYVQTERGVFRLRDFFDGGRVDAPAAAGQGRMGLAQRIADLVAGEDKARPLSDDDLVEALSAGGVRIARRTVTKYRKELGIASSFRRRRHGGQR